MDAIGLTDVGSQGKVNEDHFVIATLQKAAELRQTSLADRGSSTVLRGPEAMVFVVADGVGGRPGGAFASETAVTALSSTWGRRPGCFHNLDVDREHEFLDQLEAAVHEAHERVVGPTSGAQGQGPATTLTMATLVWPRATWSMWATAAPSTSTGPAPAAHPGSDHGRVHGGRGRVDRGAGRRRRRSAAPW